MKVALYQTNPSTKIESEGSDHPQNIFIIKDGFVANEKETLLKLISAVKTDLDSSQIITVKGNPFEHVAQAKNVVTFGFSSMELSANLLLPYYELIPMESFQLIVSESISELNQNKDKKMKLWAKLLLMFDLV